MLGETMVTAWSGHSGRATIPSGLAALGATREKRGPLGRWAPQGSDEYVRSHKALARGLLGMYVATVRAGRAYEDLVEEDAIEDVGRIMLQKGAEPNAFDKDLGRLKSEAKAAADNAKEKHKERDEAKEDNEDEKADGAREDQGGRR